MITSIVSLATFGPRMRAQHVRDLPVDRDPRRSRHRDHQGHQREAVLFRAVSEYTRTVSRIGLGRPRLRAGLNAQPLALAGIHAYQRTLAPLAARAGLRCRFAPTCSRYAESVIAGTASCEAAGGPIRRIARCGPWTPMGTVDQP